MTWFTGILVYVIIWWVLFFAILPWGVRQSQNPQLGHDKGAPENPRLFIKIVLTTTISAILWLIYYGLIQ